MTTFQNAPYTTALQTAGNGNSTHTAANGGNTSLNSNAANASGNGMSAGSSSHFDHSYFDIEMIYTSPAALDAYLGGVHQRREQRRQEREKRQHWLSAVEKIQHELVLARQDNDQEIAGELESVLRRFEMLLRTGTPAPALVSPAVTATPAPLPSAGNAYASVSSIAPVVAPTLAPPHPPALSSSPSTPAAFAPVTASVLNAPPAAVVNPKPKIENPKPDVPELSPEERERLRLKRLEEVAELTQAWKTMERDGLRHPDGSLDAPQCFRIRALVCDLGVVYARAYDDGIERAVQHDVDDLLDTIREFRRQENDRYISLPFDNSCWNDPDQALSVGQWEYLGDQYRQMAQASEVWEWYVQHENDITDDARYHLINSIAASQQALFRTLDDLEGKDRLQETFYGPICEKAKPLRFIEGLNRGTSDTQIDLLAQNLIPAWETAKTEVESRQDRSEREARAVRQQAAISAVMGLCDDDSFGDPAQLAEDQARLFPLLNACFEAGVPATNPQLREALLHCGPLLLRDQPAYAKVLDAIATERDRRGLDVGDEDEVEWETEDAPELDENVAEDTIERYKAAVRPFVSGKRIIILGGSPRQRTCDELKAALDPLEVRWPESEKTDKLAKFETDIASADMLIVAKNFARHYMSGRKVKDLVKEHGGHFLMLPSGYGLNQIIYRLFQYVCADDKR